MKEVNTADGGGYSCRATNPRINDQQKASVFTEEVTVKVECREIQQNTPIRQGTTHYTVHNPLMNIEYTNILFCLEYYVNLMVVYTIC